MVPRAYCRSATPNWRTPAGQAPRVLTGGKRYRRRHFGRSGPAGCRSPLAESVPSRRTQLAIWVRECTLSLRRICSMWPSAVRSEMTSCVAMSRLVSPWATRDATSCCRRVSCSTRHHPDQPRPATTANATPLDLPGQVRTHPVGAIVGCRSARVGSALGTEPVQIQVFPRVRSPAISRTMGRPGAVGGRRPGVSFVFRSSRSLAASDAL